jgi:hypothetical protein
MNTNRHEFSGRGLVQLQIVGCLIHSPARFRGGSGSTRALACWRRHLAVANFYHTRNTCTGKPVSVRHRSQHARRMRYPIQNARRLCRVSSRAGPMFRTAFRPRVRALPFSPALSPRAQLMQPVPTPLQRGRRQPVFYFS